MPVIKESDNNSIKLACDFLKAGKVIIFASDTVYGIAVDACNEKAVAQLYKIKERDLAKPVAVFFPSLLMAKSFFFFSQIAEKIAAEFLPGFLTLVLPMKARGRQILAKNLNIGDDNFIGFRVIKKDFVNDLLREFGGILAVSSANKSNFEAAKNCSEVLNYFSAQNMESLLVIDGGSAGNSVSTVLKIDGSAVKILREGAIVKENILKLL